MPAVTVRNIPEATHRAIKQRALQHGVSAEAEIRDILEQAVRPPERIKLGTWLYERSRPFGGVDLDITRDPTSTDSPDFE
jgi:plasmid stability protein